MAKIKMLTSQTEILFPLQMPYGLVHLLVFEKFTCAYLFQIALEIHVITYINNSSVLD